MPETIKKKRNSQNHTGQIPIHSLKQCIYVGQGAIILAISFEKLAEAPKQRCLEYVLQKP